METNNFKKHGRGSSRPSHYGCRGAHVKFFLHCMGSFEKSAFLPPSIDLNGTALRLFKFLEVFNDFAFYRKPNNFFMVSLLKSFPHHG